MRRLRFAWLAVLCGLPLLVFSGCAKKFVLRYELAPDLLEKKAPAEGIKVAVLDLGDRRLASPNFFCEGSNTFGLVPVSWFAVDSNQDVIKFSSFFNDQARTALEKKGYEIVSLEGLASLTEETRRIVEKKRIQEWMDTAQQKGVDFLVLTSLEQCKCFYADWYILFLPGYFLDTYITLGVQVVDLRRSEIAGQRMIRHQETWTWNWMKTLLFLGTPLDEMIFSEDWLKFHFQDQAVPFVVKKCIQFLDETMDVAWKKPVEPKPTGEQPTIDLDLLLYDEEK